MRFKIKAWVVLGWLFIKPCYNIFVWRHTRKGKITKLGPFYKLITKMGLFHFYLPRGSVILLQSAYLRGAFHQNATRGVTWQDDGTEVEVVACQARPLVVACQARPLVVACQALPVVVGPQVRPLMVACQARPLVVGPRHVPLPYKTSSPSFHFHTKTLKWTELKRVEALYTS